MNRTLTIIILLATILSPRNSQANEEWNEYIKDHRVTAYAPSSPPKTQAHLNALRYHKKLLLNELGKVKSDIAKGNYPSGSNALFQTVGWFEIEIEKINKYLKLNGVPGSKPLMPDIPKQFQGHWAEAPGDCKAGAESAFWFTITPAEIIYYEDACTLKQVIASDQHKFSGYFYCAGEGQEATVKILMTLDNGKLTLINKFMSGSLRNFRCK